MCKTNYIYYAHMLLCIKCKRLSRYVYFMKSISIVQRTLSLSLVKSKWRPRWHSRIKPQILLNRTSKASQLKQNTDNNNLSLKRWSLWFTWSLRDLRWNKVISPMRKCKILPHSILSKRWDMIWATKANKP